MNEFRDDLRKVLLEAGCTGKGYVFLLTDTQIVNEAMLEDINNVLNTGEFRDRLRRFPSLVNCMTIDWFTRWPEEALMGVASQTIAKMDQLRGDTPAEVDIRRKVSEMFVKIHSDVQKCSDVFWDELRRR
eukprot:gene44840-64787_t